MNTATVTNLDDERLIREGESAVELYNKDIYSARSRIMAMARGLLAARRKYPADRDFGEWLQTSPYREIEYNERAALIKLGEKDAFAEKFIRTTTLLSPRTIWDAVRELLPPLVSHDVKPSPEAQSPPKPEEITPPAPQIDKPVNPNAPPNRGAIKMTRASKLHGRPGAEELRSVFLNKHTRSQLGHLDNSAWKLVLQAHAGGLLPTPTDATIKQQSARLFFPYGSGSYLNGFDLNNRKMRDKNVNLLESMVTHKDKLLADPEHVQAILAEFLREQRNQQQQAVVAEKRVVAVRKLPAAEQELVMFGQTVWPRIDNGQGEYDYDQIRAAIWTFRDYESWNQMAKEEVGSFALRIRNSLRYLREYIYRTDRNNPMNKIFGLMIWFSFLMEKNPTAACKWPHYPHIEGQW